MADEAAAGCLTEFQTHPLAHYHKKQKSLESKTARDNHAVFLLGKTGLVERAKQRAAALTQAEEVERVDAG